MKWMLPILPLLCATTLTAQTAFGGGGSTWLSVSFSWDPVQGTELAVVGQVPAGSNCQLFGMRRADWPNPAAIVPVIQGLICPTGTYFVSTPLGATSPEPLLFALGSFSASGVEFSQVIAYDVEFRPNVINGTLPRGGELRVRQNYPTTTQEQVIARLFGDTGDLFRLIDPSGVTRAVTQPIPGPGFIDTMILPNDHPNDPAWIVQLSTDGGQNWSDFLGT